MIDIQPEDRAGSRFVERERRTKQRFLIEQEVRYKMLYGQRIAETGTGMPGCWKAREPCVRNS